MSSFNKKQMLFTLALASTLLLILNFAALVTSDDVASGQAKTTNSGVPKLTTTNGGGGGGGGGVLIPLLLVRESSDGKQDFFLEWTNWDSLQQYSTFIKPIQSTFGPFSQQASSALNNIPGASSIASQMNSFGNTASSQLSNPMQILSGGGESGSNPLASLFAMG